jgi:hypothetical protein
MTALRAAVLLPLATVACGDDENGVALRRRAAQRGVSLDVATVHVADRVPSADVYLLGGGGDIARLVGQLGESREFMRAVERGAVVLAVDAGMDALGRGCADRAGHVHTPGLGLIDVTTVPGSPADGFVVTAPAPSLALPALIGWVSHEKATVLGKGLESFAQVASGPGAGAGDGVVVGRLVGTRLHGPLLARNPEVSDLLLGWATGIDPVSYSPIEPGAAEAARAQRIAEESHPRHLLVDRLPRSVGRIGR